MSRSAQGRRTVLSFTMAGIGLFLVLLAAGLWSDLEARPDPLLGRAAPPLDLRTLDGDPIGAHSMRGRVVILNFFASWCAACRDEQGALESICDAYPPGRVLVLGVAFQDAPANVRAWGEATGVAWPLALDDHDRAALDLGVAGVPETYVIDAAGIVRDRFIGPVGESELRSAVDRAVVAGGGAAR